MNKQFTDNGNVGKYKTFICYRGSGIDDGIGKRIGQKIYDHIGNSHPVFGKCFFAPMEKNYNFMEEGQQIIRDIKYFIIILSPDFFSDFEDQKNAGTIDKDSPTYFEILTAFQNTNPGFRFLPVFTYAFDWMKNDRELLKALEMLYPGQDIGKLYHQTGIRISGDSFGKEDLERLIPCTVETVSTVDSNLLIADLRSCCNSIFGKGTRLERDACETSHYNYLCCKNGYYMPQEFFDEYDRVAEECNLPKKVFYYWPDDTGPVDDEQRAQINICAICFGIMILNSWLKNKGNYFRHTGKSARMERLAQEQIEGAVNLLIALRSPKFGSWPASWDFSSTGVQGTINQTTLSISTLIVSGFLSDSDNETFKARYHYLEKSIDWLIGAKTSRLDMSFGNLTGWGHMEHNKEMVVLPTIFAFETLLKFKSCVDDRIEGFADSDPEFARQLQDKSDMLLDLLGDIINYFYSVQDENEGGIKQLVKDDSFSISHTAKVQKSLIQFLEATEVSEKTGEMIEIAKEIVEAAGEFLMNQTVERVMCLNENEVFEQFAYNVQPAVDKSMSAEKLNELLNAALNDDSNAKNALFELLNNGPSFGPSQGENFEISGELIYIDALLNYSRIMKRDEPHTAALIYEQAVEIYNRFRSMYVRIEDTILIRGKRKNALFYPIYTMYYYKMALEDLLSCNSEGEAKI